MSHPKHPVLPRDEIYRRADEMIREAAELDAAAKEGRGPAVTWNRFQQDPAHDDPGYTEEVES